MVIVNVSDEVQTIVGHEGKLPIARVPIGLAKTGVDTVVLGAPVNVSGIEVLAVVPLEEKVPVVLYVTVAATASCGIRNAAAASSTNLLAITPPKKPLVASIKTTVQPVHLRQQAVFVVAFALPLGPALV